MFSSQQRHVASVISNNAVTANNRISSSSKSHSSSWINTIDRSPTLQTLYRQLVLQTTFHTMIWWLKETLRPPTADFLQRSLTRRRSPGCPLASMTKHITLRLIQARLRKLSTIWIMIRLIALWRIMALINQSTTPTVWNHQGIQHRNISPLLKLYSSHSTNSL